MDDNHEVANHEDYLSLKSRIVTNEWDKDLMARIDLAALYGMIPATDYLQMDKLSYLIFDIGITNICPSGKHDRQRKDHGKDKSIAWNSLPRRKRPLEM
jgi:hypothetical protein